MSSLNKYTELQQNTIATCTDSYTVINTWNSLPENLVNVTSSLVPFKNRYDKLKTEVNM